LLLFALSMEVSAQISKPWVSPTAATLVKNPITVTPMVLAEAKKIYTTNCTPCHGEKGKGDGIASAGLNPKPADHTSATVQAESDGSLFYKLSEGRGPMPQYKKSLTENQRWELICYIRTLAKKTK
jgi:mono/diheme cytochrome c family protein